MIPTADLNEHKNIFAYETYLYVCEVVRPRHKDKYGRSYALLSKAARNLSC